MTIEKSEKFVLLYPYCNRFLFIHYISILFYLIVYLFDGILFSLALIYSQETGRDILILYKLNLQIWRWAWDRSKCNQLSLRAHSRDFACSRVFNDRELRTFWCQAVLFRDSLSWFCRLYSRNLARSWRLTLVQFLPSRRIGSRSQLVCELTSYLQWWLFSGTTSDYLGYFTVPNPLCSKDFFFSPKNSTEVAMRSTLIGRMKLITSGKSHKSTLGFFSGVAKCCFPITPWNPDNATTWRLL